MANFMGIIYSPRGSVSRLGSKASGIETQANGWHSGIRDVFRVFATAGSESKAGAHNDGWQPA